MLAQSAAGSVIGMGATFISQRSCFPFFGEVLFCFAQASTCWLAIASVLIPIAQMNPSGSRAIAVVILTNNRLDRSRFILPIIPAQ